MDYLDIQISLDGIDAATNDAVRGDGSLRHRPGGRWTTSPRPASGRSRSASSSPATTSTSSTSSRRSPTRTARSCASPGCARAVAAPTRWHDLHPTNAQQRQIYHWLLANGDTVLTGDSFFHLNALGEPLPGLNMCGAGRVVCLIDPIGDVYACPFVIHDQFKAGSVRDAGGFANVWKHSELFLELREPQSAGACASCGSYDACQGGCMAAKFFTGLPLDGPDPECVNGHGDAVLGCSARRADPTPLARPLATRSERCRSRGAERAPNDKVRAAVRLTDRRCTRARSAGLPARHVSQCRDGRPIAWCRHPDAGLGQPRRVERRPRARHASGARWSSCSTRSRERCRRSSGWLSTRRPGAYVLVSAAVLGHMFPATRKFRGGKGVATMGGAMLTLHPLDLARPAGRVDRRPPDHRQGVAGLAGDHRRLPVGIAIPGVPAWEIVYVIALVLAGARASHRQHQAIDRPARAVARNSR